MLFHTKEKKRHVVTHMIGEGKTEKEKCLIVF